jgi:hypothetical protein
MNHIKNILNDTNTYGVDFNFIIDEDNNSVKGTTTGDETESELKMVYENLKRMGFIKKYNKPTEISFLDFGETHNGFPTIDLYFDVNGERDDNNTPICTIDDKFLTELGF